MELADHLEVFASNKTKMDNGIWLPLACNKKCKKRIKKLQGNKSVIRHSEGLPFFPVSRIVTLHQHVRE